MFLKKPFLKMDYIKKLTDDVGIIQHAKFATALKKEGYTTDDNARALIVCTNYLNHFRDTQLEKLVEVYLSFLFFMQKPDGKMHNFLSFHRKVSDKVGSEDCMGRTLWACGNCLGSKLKDETKLIAKETFDKTMRWATSFKATRSKALSILGLYYYQKAYPADPNPVLNIKILADQLMRQFEAESSTEWSWFESNLTYDNAQISLSLLRAWEITGDEKYKLVALRSLEFLLQTQTIDSFFVPIGNRGWYKRGQERAIYDQQPVESACTIEAALAAYKQTTRELFLCSALDAFGWFLGKNTKDAKVYDPKTGGCCDGITPEGLNLNKGAEACISYLHARLILEDYNNS
jgi:hypothetical protein